MNDRHSYRLITAALLIFVAGCSAQLDRAEVPPPPSVQSATIEAKPYVGSSSGALVAAANPLAVDAGIEVLAAGGSAIDAAIAVQAVLGLVEPQSSGLGGGAFLVHYDASTGDVVTYDGREIAPRGATPDMFLDSSGRPL
ncbi:MAG: gamma-glutamyltransferase, partial [Steroidobacteraceae bacterium]